MSAVDWIAAKTLANERRSIIRSCDNRSAAPRWWNTERPLTHPSGTSREGLEVNSTHFGDPRLPQRFWDKIEISDTGCWEWQGHRIWSGYGQIKAEGSRKVLRVHRFAYACLVGPIGEGLVLDHTCKVRWCANPDHLEPVTQRENLLRGDTIVAAAARKTHCKHGHEFTPENTRMNSQGYRLCRTCRRAGARAYKARNR